MKPPKSIRRPAFPLAALLAAGVIAGAAGLTAPAADRAGATGSPDAIGGP